MNKKFIAVLGVCVLLAPGSAAYALSSEIHVTRDGKTSVSGAKIMQMAGNTLFTRLYWGDAFVRFTVKTNANTKFLRATGEATTIAEINNDDLLDITGELESQSETLTIMASSIKNSSVQKEQAILSGTVTSVDLSLHQFAMKSRERGLVTINVATSTQFSKGTRTINLEHIRTGDRITKTSGDYNLSSKTLEAKSVTVYIDLNTFKPKLFVGKLMEVPAYSDVVSMKVSINKTPYTVFLNNNVAIMRNNKSTTTLQRFVAGDTLRIFGAMREIDEPIIDAEVVRNTNL